MSGICLGQISCHQLNLFLHVVIIVVCLGCAEAAWWHQLKNLFGKVPFLSERRDHVASTVDSNAQHNGYMYNSISPLISVNSSAADQMHELLLQNAVLREEVSLMRRSARDTIKYVQQLRKERDTANFIAERKMQQSLAEFEAEKVHIATRIQSEIESEKQNAIQQLTQSLQQEAEANLISLKEKHQGELAAVKSALDSLQGVADNSSAVVQTLELSIQQKESELAELQGKYAKEKHLLLRKIKTLENSLQNSAAAASVSTKPPVLATERSDQKTATSAPSRTGEASSASLSDDRTTAATPASTSSPTTAASASGSSSGGSRESASKASGQQQPGAIRRPPHRSRGSRK